jgi:hypothetical protein
MDFGLKFEFARYPLGGGKNLGVGKKNPGVQRAARCFLG